MEVSAPATLVDLTSTADSNENNDDVQIVDVRQQYNTNLDRTPTMISAPNE